MAVQKDVLIAGGVVVVCVALVVVALYATKKDKPVTPATDSSFASTYRGIVMSSWLKLMLSQVAAVSDADVAAAEPNNAGCEHDHEVGMLEGDLRKLYVLHYQSSNAAREAELALIRSGDGDDSILLENAARLKSSAETLRHMFWSSCYHEFPVLHSLQNIGIRNGWKVVWCDHGTHPMMSLLLGGGLEALFGALDKVQAKTTN